MIPEKCAECLAEISQKSETVLNNFETQFKHRLHTFDENSTTHFKEQSEKYDKFEEKVINMVKYFMLGISAVIFICSTIVGITWISVQSKIDKADALTKNEARALRELGDDYNKKIFVQKDEIKADTTAYYYFKKNVFGDYSITRSVNNN